MSTGTIDERMCDIRHAQNEKDHEGMKELIRILHESDERFVNREVIHIAEKLQSLEKLERRIVHLEKWRYYTIGAFAAIVFTIELILKFII